jgi:predicted ester cyclase
MTPHSLLVALALTAAPAQPESKAQAAAQALEEKWNRHELDATVALFSDSATVTWVVDPASGPAKVMPDLAFSGHEDIRAFLETDLAGFHLEPGPKSAEVDHTSWTATMRSEGLRKLGADSVEANCDLLVGADGRIAAFTLALTPQSAQKIVPAIPALNKAVLRRFYEQLNRKNLAVIDELVTSNFVQHASLPLGPGRPGLKEFFVQLRTAFPDFHFDLDDLIAEGDRVAIRMTARYTHKGEFMGVAPTGKAVTLLKMDFMRLVNGKIIEHWDAADRLGLLQQLGVVPRLPTWQASPGYEGFR